MKELTNSRCLQHVSGGAFGWTGDDCPGCRGDWDKQDKNSQSQNSRGTVVWIGSWIGGSAGAVASAATGVGLGTSILIGNSIADFGGFVAGAIYDNPESAEHPDFYVPVSNLVNPYK